MLGAVKAILLLLLLLPKAVLAAAGAPGMPPITMLHSGISSSIGVSVGGVRVHRGPPVALAAGRVRVHLR
jgi:hypothetical protein